MRSDDGHVGALSTHEVISSLFQAMNATDDERENLALPRWSSSFPTSTAASSQPAWTCRASAKSRGPVGGLEWAKINPDMNQNQNYTTLRQLRSEHLSAATV